MTIRKMFVLTVLGVFFAFVVAKKDFWWPTATTVADSIATALSTPDPDHS